LIVKPNDEILCERMLLVTRSVSEQVNQHARLLPQKLISKALARPPKPSPCAMSLAVATTIKSPIKYDRDLGRRRHGYPSSAELPV
jgi:hypothetical protein